MKKIIYALLSLVFLSGCATKFEVNPNYPTDNTNFFSYDEEYCSSIARGYTPTPPVDYSYIPDERFNYRGTINNGFNSYNYTGSAYVDNSYARMNQGMQNLGFAMGYAIAVQSKENDCMKSLGWKQVSELTENEKIQIQFNDVYVQTFKNLDLNEQNRKILEAMGNAIRSMSVEQRQEVYKSTIEMNGKNLIETFNEYQKDFSNPEFVLIKEKNIKNWRLEVIDTNEGYYYALNTTTNNKDASINLASLKSEKGVVFSTMDMFIYDVRATQDNVLKNTYIEIGKNKIETTSIIYTYSNSYIVSIQLVDTAKLDSLFQNGEKIKIQVEDMGTYSFSLSGYTQARNEVLQEKIK